MNPIEFIKLIKAKIEELGEQDDFIDEEIASEHDSALSDIHESCEAFLNEDYDKIVID
jgi:hypothetical protein